METTPTSPARRSVTALPGRHVFADFEGTTWGAGWTATGDFTNAGPAPAPSATSNRSAATSGKQLVNTFTRPRRVHRAPSPRPRSPSTSDYIDLLVGGGNHPLDGPSRPDRGQPARRRQRGRHRHRPEQRGPELGRPGTSPPARASRRSIQIVDQNTGGWGHIIVDHIVFSPTPPAPGRSRPPSTCSSTARSSAPPPAEQRAASTGPTGTWRPPGQAGHVQIVDHNTGGWGHILADQFTCADAAAPSAVQRAHWLDYGADDYAAVTFNDVPGGKRIMIGWMNNWLYGGNPSRPPPGAAP